MSRRGRGPSQRDLEAIAKRVEEVEDAGKISPRHAKLVGQALQHARRVHFWNARRVLAKIEKGLAPSRAWHAALEACTRAADESWSDLTHRPTAEAIADLVGHPDLEGLGLLAVQEFAAPRGRGGLVEAGAPLEEEDGDP